MALTGRREQVYRLRDHLITMMKQLTCVDEGVGVLLEEQVLQDAALGHQPEQVVVAAKEDVQPAAGVRGLSMAT